jgi:hypothetical protein
MRNLSFRPHLSFQALCGWTVGALALAYVALIAVVMSYGAMTVSFSQSVKDDEASVAGLEARYLAAINSIEGTDYRVAGYAKPVAITYVPAQSATALR